MTSRQSRQHFSLDHLGSARLTTDRNGTPIFSHNYYPYGEEVGTAFDSEQLRLTGHERDFAGGTYDLDYMQARHCSSQLGRFLIVDPAASSRKGIPQSWNRFLYAQSNPLNLVDPDGGRVKQPKDKRSQRAIEAVRSTTDGEAGFQIPERASDIYSFSRRDSVISPVDRIRARTFQKVILNKTGHFSPAYEVQDGVLVWLSEGDMFLDFGVVDSADQAESPR